jgi:hypothetical protein
LPGMPPDKDVKKRNHLFIMKKWQARKISLFIL